MLMRYFPIAILLFTLTLSNCSARKNASTDFGMDLNKYNGHYKIGSAYKINGKWYHPEVNDNYDQVGIASWYGPGFQNKKTANGVSYDKHTMTAAHPTLPMPSVVKVTNLKNGKSVNVMVTDRGPFKKNRIIDVSEEAAEKLGMKISGIAKVRVQLLAEDSNNLLLALNMQDKASKVKARALNKNKHKKQVKSPINKSTDSDEDANADEIMLASNDISAKLAKNKSTKQIAQTKTDSNKLLGKKLASNDKAKTFKVLADSETSNLPTPVSANKLTKVASNYYVEVDAYENHMNAVKAAEKWGKFGKININRSKNPAGNYIYKVVIGPTLNKAEASSIASNITSSAPNSKTLIVALD